MPRPYDDRVVVPNCFDAIALGVETEGVGLRAATVIH